MPHCERGRPPRAHAPAQTSNIRSDAITATLAWSGIVTFILLKVISFVVPMRVSVQNEIEGLDVTQHGEALQ